MNVITGMKAMVACRYRDGRIYKGVAADFHADKPLFHVYAADDQKVATEIQVAELKAVFFVKDFMGNPAHATPAEFGDVRGQGKKVIVTFEDGETLRGHTLGYNPTKRGFFVVPADADGNNVRVFVVSAAVKKLEWA